MYKYIVCVSVVNRKDWNKGKKVHITRNIAEASIF